MKVDSSVRVEESKAELKDMSDRMDDDNYDVTYVYERSNAEEDSKCESEDDVFLDDDDNIDEAGMKVTLFWMNEDKRNNVKGLTCYVPDSMFEENDLDVIDNEEFD
ncbi:hypothetical protein Tco_0476543, partial [Tanacetum coccineum]